MVWPNNFQFHLVETVCFLSLAHVTHTVITFDATAAISYKIGGGEHGIRNNNARSMVTEMFVNIFDNIYD